MQFNFTDYLSDSDSSFSDHKKTLFKRIKVLSVVGRDQGM